MNCETARAAVVDALADTVDDDARAALDRHLAQCEACRLEAERIRSLWRELGELETAVAPAGSTARLILADDSAPVASPIASSGRTRLPLLAASVALLIGLASGWFARDAFGMQGDTPPTVTTVPDADFQQYMLVLHGPPAPPPGAPPPDPAGVATAVARYSAWADTLRMRGRLVAAEKLQPGDQRWLGEFTDSGPPGSDIGGFFLILARSWAEAESIANGSPHLRYGGTIELRAIENTGGS